MPDAITALMT